MLIKTSLILLYYLTADLRQTDYFVGAHGA